MSQKLTNNQLQEIESLIYDEKWDEAESSLLNLQETGDGRAYYLLGYIFDNWNNPKRNKEKATRYFSLATESDNSIQDAFVRLARLETNKSHSIRILRKGLQVFPNSEPIYYQLLNYTRPSAKEDIYREADAKGCISERIKIRMAMSYFQIKEFDETLNMLSIIQTDDKDDIDVLKCIEGFSLCEIGNANKAYELFKVKFPPFSGQVLKL